MEKLKLEGTEDITGGDTQLYKLPDNAEILIPDRLWVVFKQDSNGARQSGSSWLEFAFLEKHYKDDTMIACSVLMHGGGPLGNLREGRHTYWGEDGYIFYPNAKNIAAAMGWLKAKGYDLD